MRKRSFLVSILALCLYSSIHGQAPQTVSIIHNTHKISSQVLGEERTILVRVPVAYQRSDKKFPVIYMLDAHAPHNAMMAGIVEQQAWGGTLPEMIIVGIQNTNRVRDLTPTKTDRPDSGGGDKFLDFIEKEVIPLVEKNYRTEPFRIFAGHSLGGLTAVYAFVSRPELFNAYIAASPFLHWDNNFVIKRAEEIFRQKKDWKKMMFIGLGNEPDYVDGFNSFKDLLKRSNPKNLDYEFQQFPADNHASVVLPAYYAGLRKIFAGWPPPESGNVSDLENHYKKLTDRFGYQIPVPENLMNQAGYQLMRENRVDEAIAVFRKNAEIHPNSANCYDSLAEALEKSGRLKQAMESYEKAYKMAEARGQAQLAKSSKANFDRISEKVR